MEEQAGNNPKDWVDLYGDSLYYYALGRVRNPQVAEEVVQETFLAALKSRDSFRGGSSEKTWILGILKHKVIDHFRRKKKENPVDDPSKLPDPDSRAYDARGRRIDALKTWGKDPLKKVEDKEFWTTFRNCVEAVPDSLADAFVLREYEELPSEEICSILGISINNLWVRLHRARAQIRNCLEKNFFYSSEVKS